MPDIEFSIVINPDTPVIRTNRLIYPSVISTFDPKDGVIPIRLKFPPHLYLQNENRFSSSIFEIIGCTDCPRFRALAKNEGYTNESKLLDNEYYSIILHRGDNRELFPEESEIFILNNGCRFPCPILDDYNLPPISRSLQGLCRNKKHSFNSKKYPFLFNNFS